MSSARWSSQVAFYLAGVGAAVGLGSIWRFPYLTGSLGGSAFVFVFLVAILAIATPLLVAEYMIGRQSRRNPAQAAGEIAASFGRSRAWNAIGLFGLWTAILIMSYYTIIAGWVMAYIWKCGSGELTSLARSEVPGYFNAFLAQPIAIGGWHLAFILLVAVISAGGVSKGIEVATKIRAPGLMILLMILTCYALTKGNVHRGLTFAFAPEFSRLSGGVILAAVGQAFFATGVGMGMMLAYGAYVPAGVSLIRSSLIVSGSIVLVSLLATVMIFPLVFEYGLDPAQGPDLVFNVLPIAFAEMPAGRLIGTLFFVLLLLSALTPTLAGLEPLVAWLQERHRMSRAKAAFAGAGFVWILGVPSVLSFNRWAGWHPFAAIPRLKTMTVFDTLDFASSNLMLTLGALLTCIFIGWRLPRSFADLGLPEETSVARYIILLLLRYVCPVGIVAVLVAGIV
jgi:NSS family neurotransmitter:Na+ symporter